LESKYLYLILNLITIGLPLLLSFDKKVAYFKRWKYLFPSIFIMAVIFIVWDVVFTKFGIWGFNEKYLVGLNIINLPIEEWLFFITIPYASVFIYDCIKYYFPNLGVHDTGNIIAVVLGILLAILAILNLGKHYTYITFISLSLILLLLVIRRSKYLGRFFISYGIVLIPFFIVNGILTGSWIPEPVVWYNDNFNLDFRLWTIPLEDVFYGMLLILGNVAFYEYFQKRSMIK
jgi:lycopene cyclase domain-containing protein